MKITHPTILENKEFFNFIENDKDIINLLRLSNCKINTEEKLEMISKELEIGYFEGLSFADDIYVNIPVIYYKTKNPIKRFYRRIEALYIFLKLNQYDISKIDFNPFKFHILKSYRCLVSLYRQLFSCDLDAFVNLVCSIEINVERILDENKQREIDKFNTFLLRKFHYGEFKTVLFYKNSFKYSLMIADLHGDNFMWIQYFLGLATINSDGVNYSSIVNFINDSIKDYLYKNEDKSKLDDFKSNLQFYDNLRHNRGKDIN